MRSVILLSVVFVIVLTGCSSSRKTSSLPPVTKAGDIKSTVHIKKKVAPRTILTKNTPADEVVTFAETLIGTRYKYGSVEPSKGLDCSGFISYVFNHFGISVPRITYDFTNAGKEVPLKNSKRGDIILFTGSDQNSGIVGHMGIITRSVDGIVEFIHASSSRGVMISGMNSYFVPRFVKVNRVFSF